MAETTPTPAAATIFALPPERQLSVGVVERQLSTHSGTAQTAGKCFPVEFMMESGYFTMPIAQPPIVSLRRKIATELIGTFVLIFAATATPIVNEKTGGSVTLLGNAATAGLAIMIVIFATGHISGAHVNPAITIAFAALRHFPWIQVPFYIAAQVLGSIAASFALKGIFHPYMHGGVTLPQGDEWPSFVLEFIISFNLMFVITAVATDTRAVGELAGIAVGACVMMNIMIAGSTSGASMNPVRSLGPAIAANNFKSLWLYIVAPVMGMVAGATAYTIVRLNVEAAPPGGLPVRSFRR
jgi:aquaporin NIP